MNFLAFAAQNARHEFRVDRLTAENRALDAQLEEEERARQRRVYADLQVTRAIQRWTKERERHDGKA